jgi:hypothetical protein
MFDNLVEITQFFGERAEEGSASQLAGKPQGIDERYHSASRRRW